MLFALVILHLKSEIMQSTIINAIERTTQELIQESFPKAMSYTVYRELVAQLAQEGKSTGPEQTDALANYTQLNDRRMKRWDKTLKFDEQVTDSIKSLERPITWLVLTESWCGDASPALPVIQKITELNPNISLKIILRDANVELMNRFLTNGSMSIPKVISVDNESEEVVSEWGPRPEPAAELVRDHKAKYGKLLPEIKEEIQQWYNKDKGQTMLKELLARLPLK